ncbi:carboxypeptidase family protein [Pandoraea nosoerga]|uniref:Peptidase M14, carboxypeptidase A n=1 Tax=Pandoraea nosoerga TaxID=2508296 RepID=A0A5E4TSW3_9BURK|nr:carboxypeptidase family protein [Pandoraea nosoerga]MBN4664974.1 carboxypeptidase family protein [Pandoraea nosoerga]MBN4675310.1 carboxypeptidase family protein [Pandoraea nosoerga]MBN4680717.1 carboxypeptidase family protein [Pandoraea nosoerga]MBN4745903.1 carboxypeptidase family protein [Pandoraea nosoerga]VVD90867.1 peptidase M14, carboxypeptidase A [Pandoraea nosoerga]
MTVQISSRFDSGAIHVVSAERADDIHVRVPQDGAAEFAQWFHFRVQGVGGKPCRIVFDNAGQTSYPRGWENYRAVASYDRVDWFRVPTTYDGQVMTVAFTPAHDSVYLAYFEPYPEERHLALLGTAQNSPRVRSRSLGQTIDARDMTLLTVGEPGEGKRNIWVIARQHPGETMAEWFVEGLLRRLLGAGDWAGDPLAAAVLDEAVFHVVPNMNPDGAARGNLRTNAAGANLNREWLEPDPLRSPEVYHVRAAIESIGCDMFFDIHGDEALPYVFLAGNEGVEWASEAILAREKAFGERFKAASLDFQDRFGYPPGKHGAESLKLASKWVAHRFGCLSLTLEMPFKDNANRPDARVGWSGARSAALGASMLAAIGSQLQADKAQAER